MDEEVEISLEDLSRTYQRIFSDQQSQAAVPEASSSNTEEEDFVSEPLWSPDEVLLHESVPMTPEGVLEAVLFVGHPKNRAFSSTSLAGLMRGLSSSEIPAIVDRLNERYQRCRQAFRIIETEQGFHLTLVPEMNEIKCVFAGKVQPAKLNQQAIDCLALIAYNPGVTLEELEANWNRPAGGVLRMLIRRNLVELKIEGKGKSAVRKHYTTQRFLNLAGLESLDDLPVAWD